MKKLIIGLMLWGITLGGQTVINGGRTVKGPWDASGAASTKALKTGTALPAICGAGEMFFKTGAPAGQNLYLCSPDNTWARVAVNAADLSGTLAAGQLPATIGSNTTGNAATATALAAAPTTCAAGSYTTGINASGNAQGCTVAPGGSMVIAAFTVTRNSSGTQLTMGPNCAPSTPCKVGIGSAVVSLAASATVTLSAGAGAGTAYIWIDTSGAIHVGHNLVAPDVSCSGATCGAAAGYPTSNVFPAWRWTATNDTWDVSGGTDDTAVYRVDKPISSSNLTITESANARTMNIDTNQIPQKFFGTSVPGSVAGNLPGDSFTDTTNHHEYVCNAPSGTAAPACTAVSTAGWLLVNGSALASQAADTVVMNATGGSAAPTAVAMPTCTTGAVLYSTATHAWTCVSVGGTALLRSLNGPGIAAKCQGGVAGAGFSVPAAAQQPSTDAAPLAACESDGIQAYLPFTTATAQIVTDVTTLPEDWAGTLKMILSAYSTSANTPTITVALSCISTGAVASPTFGTTQSVSMTTLSASGRTAVSTILATDATHATKACAAGDVLNWKLAVTAVTNDLRVLSVRFTE